MNWAVAEIKKRLGEIKDFVRQHGYRNVHASDIDFLITELEKRL